MTNHICCQHRSKYLFRKSHPLTKWHDRPYQQVIKYRVVGLGCSGVRAISGHIGGSPEWGMAQAKKKPRRIHRPGYTHIPLLSLNQVLHSWVFSCLHLSWTFINGMRQLERQFLVIAPPQYSAAFPGSSPPVRSKSEPLPRSTSRQERHNSAPAPSGAH